MQEDAYRANAPRWKNWTQSVRNCIPTRSVGNDGRAGGYLSCQYTALAKLDAERPELHFHAEREEREAYKRMPIVPMLRVGMPFVTLFPSARGDDSCSYFRA